MPARWKPSAAGGWPMPRDDHGERHREKQDARRASRSTRSIPPHDFPPGVGGWTGEGGGGGGGGGPDTHRSGPRLEIAHDRDDLRVDKRDVFVGQWAVVRVVQFGKDRPLTIAFIDRRLVRALQEADRMC